MADDRYEVPLHPYDQQTLEYLKAAGISGELLQRVRWLAQLAVRGQGDAYHWSDGTEVDRAELAANHALAAGSVGAGEDGTVTP